MATTVVHPPRRRVATSRTIGHSVATVVCHTGTPVGGRLNQSSSQTQGEHAQHTRVYPRALYGAAYGPGVEGGVCTLHLQGREVVSERAEVVATWRWLWWCRIVGALDTSHALGPVAARRSKRLRGRADLRPSWLERKDVKAPGRSVEEVTPARVQLTQIGPQQDSTIAVAKQHREGGVTGRNPDSLYDLMVRCGPQGEVE